MSDVTSILHQIESGDLSSADQLSRLVYDELRKLSAAEAMRRILLHRARDKRRLKRGGQRHQVSLELVELAVDTPHEDLLALDESIDQLATENPDSASEVKMRLLGNHAAPGSQFFGCQFEIRRARHKESQSESKGVPQAFHEYHRWTEYPRSAWELRSGMDWPGDLC
jgi:hypothetical protein